MSAAPSILLSSLVSVLPLSPVFAQPTGEPKSAQVAPTALISFEAADRTPEQTKTSSAAQPTSSSPQPAIKEVKFDGGPLDKYRDYLETLFDKPNIILDGDDVVKTVLPRAYLRVSLSQALDWVSGTADARKRHVTLQKTNGVYTFTTMQRQGVGVTSTEADKLTKTYALLNTDGSWTQPAGAALKEVVSGLQTKEAARGVDFNEQTRLLIVTGTRSDVQMADQVIEELTRARRAAASITAVQTEVSRLNARIENLEAKIRELTKGK